MPFELDTKALRYFSAVATHGSYSLAASHLRITQPAVSRQIQAIEQAYGTRLFKRDGRRVALTEAGAVLYRKALEIVAQLDEVGSLVMAASKAPSGRISLGVPAAAGQVLLPQIIHRYRLKYPGVFIHIVQAYASDLAEMLAAGKIDAALIYGQPRHVDLELHPLLDMELGLVVPMQDHQVGRDPLLKTKKISLSKAATLPLIFPSRAQTLRTVVEDECKKIGVLPNIILESDSLGLSKALVMAGEGCMFLGYIGVKDEVERGEVRFIPVTSPVIRWHMSFALRRIKSPTIAVQAMKTEILDRVRQGAESGYWNSDV
jgi:LysR family nitrogen assimilation transcriptional regulator